MADASRRMNACRQGWERLQRISCDLAIPFVQEGEDGDSRCRQDARDKQQTLDIGLAEPGSAHGRPSCPRPSGARHDVGPLPQVETPGAQVADTLQKLPRTPGAARCRLGAQSDQGDPCPRLARELTAMSTFWLILLGAMAGTGAGLLAGLIGIGGGIVVVPVVYYGLTSSGISIDQAVHVAVATSLAAILPASIVSFVGHWRAGNADIGFLRPWGPGLSVGRAVAQPTAP